MIKGCGGIIIEKGKVLLMKRKNAKFFNNIWSNPGGKTEEGEVMEEAVKRELKEELGIIVNIVKKISDYHWEEKNNLGMFTGYEVVIESGEPKIMEPNKCSQIGWFKLDNLPQPLAPYTKQYLYQLECLK